VANDSFRKGQRGREIPHKKERAGMYSPMKKVKRKGGGKKKTEGVIPDEAVERRRG